MMDGFWAGAGWGVAGGLVVALLITLWVLVSVLGLLRKVTGPLPPTESADVLHLQQTHARGGGRS